MEAFKAGYGLPEVTKVVSLSRQTVSQIFKSMPPVEPTS